jgi:hypothetical protein
MSYFGKLFLRRASDGADINPAQEDGNLATLAGVDFATENTLSLINTEIGTISGVMVDGTQKTIITDGTDDAAVVTGSYGTEKGLRVYIGPTDTISDLPVTIDFPHHQVHEGESYVVSDYNTALTTRDYLLVVPAGKYPHLIIEFAVDQRVTCTVYRAPTTSANGTALPAINRNHNSGNTAGMSVYHTPTVTATGTDIVDRYMVGSGEKAGGLSRADNEMVLHPSTNYLIRMAGTNFIMNTRLLWYEDLGV